MSASSLVEPATVVEVREEEWSAATRVAFRFCVAFLLLYNFPFPLTFVPQVGEWLAKPWDWIVPFVGQTVFGVKAEPVQNGSGDTTFAYVQLFLMVAAAFVSMLVWSLVSRATSYPRLHHWLRVYVRYALAMWMIFYGAIKVIPSQFPAPTLDRLIQPFGEASPMGLLWTLMGASAAYSTFTGLGEMIGGLLLTTRRTTLAGALVSAGVMTHVVVLNFCYDVPVKLFSSALLFMALFLAAPDAKRLFAFFFAAPPRAVWWKVAIRTVVVVGFASYALYSAQSGRKEYGDLSPRSPLRGIWNVEQITIDGVEQPPLLSNVTRWRRMIFDGTRGTSIQLVSDQRNRYSLQLTGNILTLGKRDDPAWKATFRYSRPKPDTLVLAGTMDGRNVHATMKLDTDKEFLLLTRGFHWINEFPFNR
jgi:hypothetical protein